jgi:DNA polymerase-3 subunit gamma/tau
MGRGPSAAVLAFDGDWPALVAALKLDGLAGQLAAHSELLSSDAGHFRLRVALKTLLDAGAAERLRICLQKHFGGAVRVSAEFGAALTPTAAVRAGEARGRQQQLAAEAIYADPFVRELVASFGAEVDPGSIRPPQDESGTGPDAVAA